MYKTENQEKYRKNLLLIFYMQHVVAASGTCTTLGYLYIIVSYLV